MSSIISYNRFHMMFEVPAFGPFKKKVLSDTPQPEKTFAGMGRVEREQTMRNQLHASRYRETKAEAGEGIIVGGEPETYPVVKTEARDAVQDDGLLAGEDESKYSVEQKVEFMKAWSDDLSRIACGIPGILPGRAGASQYETSTGLLVEWDTDGARPVWIRMEESGDSLRKDEIRDISEIAKSFPLSLLEAAFDGAKTALERLKRSEAIKKGGPKPPVGSFETEEE